MLIAYLQTAEKNNIIQKKLIADCRKLNAKLLNTES
jgi:hypothetical protein